MIKPIPLVAVALLWIVTSSLSAQDREPTCKSIPVEIKTTAPTRGSQNGKITLEFSSNLRSRDFNMFLFAPQKANNRMNFTAPEINGLARGKYVLVIQSKNDQSYCSKQFNLTLE